MVGRDPELALGARLLTPEGPWPRGLVLEGLPGIGKTTVLREIVRRADRAGVLVLACQPAQAETKMALSGIGDLLERVPRERLAALPRAHRRAIDVALLRTDSRGEPSPPRMLATAVRSLLAELSAERPLLVAVDDAQWLDGTSATVLGFALRRLPDARVACLVTRREGETRGFDPPRLSPGDGVVRARIPGLSFEELAAVLDDRLPRPLSRLALTRVHRASGGNPFYALEIARALEEAEIAAAGPLPIPDDLRQLQTRRLRRLPPRTRAALLEAAALSSPTTALVDADALGPAEDAGIVRVDRGGRVAFGHPLFASAIYAAAPPSRRRRLHRGLAERIGDPEERARHLALAAAGPDPGTAARLEEAADLARARGAPDSAGELFERARELTPGDRPADRRRRAVRAAEMHVQFGDRARARRLLEEILRESCAPGERASVLRLLAEISHHDDSFDEAARLLRDALRLAEGPELKGAVELGLSYVESNLMDWGAALRHARRALDHARASGNALLEAQALAYRAMMGFLVGHGADWRSVERAIALEGPDPPAPLVGRPALIEALLRLYVGEHDLARAALHRLAAEAVGRGDESDVAFVLLWLSWLETRAGRFAEASRLAAEAAALARLTGSASMHAWVLTQRAYVAAHTGDAEEVRRRCAEATAPVQASGRLLPGLWTAAALALLELSLGDAEAAARACEPALAALERRGIGEPVPAFFLPDALEALVAIGERERARRLVDALQDRGRALGRGWATATAARCRALLLAAEGDLSGALGAVDAALLAHERLDMPFERARALALRGTLERRARRREPARRSLQEAVGELDRLGAALLAARARDELARIPTPRAARGLTPGELRVAERAAAGLTNREVAAELFISPKTVESNLARAYRKLGIRSRAELGAWLARERQT